MTEANELAILVRQADQSLREAIVSMHLARNKAIDAVGVLNVINSGHLANASAAIRVGLREIEGQLTQFQIAADDIDSYRRRLE